MKQISITVNGNSIDLDLPTTLGEIKLNQYASFEKALQDYDALTGEGDIDYQIRYVRCVATCLKEFFGADFLQSNLPTGDFINHLRDMARLKKGELLDLDSLEDTLFSIFQYLCSLTLEYKQKQNVSDEYHFTYKGERFEVYKTFRDAISGTLKFAAMPTGKVVEALEAIKLYESVTDDANGNFRFTTLLKMIAIFAIRKGESFPTLDEDIEFYINEQVRFFADIPMNIALDIEHFFFGTTQALLNNRVLSISSTSQKVA